MLEVHNLNAAYGQHSALEEVSLSVAPNEIVVILGANGAGKSTLLRAIAGICEGRVDGDIRLAGQSLVGLNPDAIVERGLALVPEGRGIFPDLSVHENLLLGAYTERARASEQENLSRVLNLFPKLEERKNQVARTMSGGEQQMVAIARAMMSAPDILMLDEPSLGLAPLLCKELFENLAKVKELGIGILLVEQNARQSLAIADRGYLLENTRITHQDSAANLATDSAVQQAYLGGSVKAQAEPSTETQPTATQTPTVTTLTAPTTGSFSASIGEIRRSADQQIGGSIEELVAQASIASAAQTETSVNGRYSGKQRGLLQPVISASEVKRITGDIESAAKQARERANTRSTVRAGASYTSNRHSATNRLVNQRPVNSAPLLAQHSDTTAHDVDTSDEQPVVIEVYKRPLVEVYRRRPSGEFERN